MPITVDGSSFSSGKAIMSLTFAHTVSAVTDRVLLVRAALNDNPGTDVITGITFNGVALLRHSFISAGGVRSELWYLGAPPVGTFNVIITVNAATIIVASASSFWGVDQLSPIGNAATSSGTSTTPGGSVAVADPDPTVCLVVDALAASEVMAGTQTATATAPQIVGVNQKTVGAPVAQNILQATSRLFATGAAQAMSWTLSSSAAWAEIVSYLRPSRIRIAFNAKGSATDSFSPAGPFDYALDRRLKVIELGIANINPTVHW